MASLPITAAFDYNSRESPRVTSSVNRREGLGESGRFAMQEEKLQKVTSWLNKIFGDQPIPSYETDARTVDILHELAERNESRNEDVSLLIKDMKQKAAEYESEGRYLQDLLTENLNLSFSSLSKASTSYLNTLVNTALVLETKDTSLARSCRSRRPRIQSTTRGSWQRHHCQLLLALAARYNTVNTSKSFIPAINDLTSDRYAVESKNKDMELELTNFRKKLTSALMLEKRLQDDLTKTEEILVTEKAKVDSRTENMKFLKDKSEDFKFRIKAAEEQLSLSGLDASLTHESLVNLSEKLAELKKQTSPLKKKLKSYRDLPPSPSLALVKIADTKRELETLEAEFSTKMDMTAFS